MNGEIMKLRGRLACAEKTAELLEAGIDGDIDIIRGFADKYEDKTDLKIGAIIQAAQRIDEAVTKLKGLQGQIKALKKELDTQ